MSPRRALILGLAGPDLPVDEARFLREIDPWGLILFGRNVETPAQLRRLTEHAREALGWEAPILIDQEGGRVQRMGPPHWRAYLPAFDQMARARDPIRAQFLRYRLIAHELREVGIDVNCAPLGDVHAPETHAILANRTYGDDPAQVAAAGRACADGLLAGGVLPVLKHMPGQGRAPLDSHRELPRVSTEKSVLQAHDFAPFRALNDLPMGMTGHVVFSALDAGHPATHSASVIRMIREDIGFDGLLMTDDLSMEALSGTIGQRGAAALAVGCDLALHCNANRAEMEALAGRIGALNPQAQARADAALALRRAPEPVDIAALSREFEGLLS